LSIVKIGNNQSLNNVKEGLFGKGMELIG
jgi:hypothetical protein